jgi:DNA processing protein
LLGSSAFSIVTQEDEQYPGQLFELTDPPACLFVRGTFPAGNAVSIVGTRKATPLGLSLSRSFGCDLASAGLAVVSGMADGIDQASHNGALDAGGITVAVLGEGFDVIPVHKKKLAEQIISKGAVISEFPPSFPAQRWSYPFRNRIIAALSKATLVIEAPEGSGALITARYALELHREVLATPGAPGIEGFRGCNRLIKDGARLVDCVEDVLDVFGIKQHAQSGQLSDVEEAIVSLCGEPCLFDRIVSELGLDSNAVMGYLTILDMKGLVRKMPGGFYLKSSFSNAKGRKNRS